ncbi:MAG: GNAT family N-acetyltransferase [Deltaproteobacteria bacterium]|nr:GNAT family N-acetyltransferase [Deltaproteobacteria bacterium]
MKYNIALESFESVSSYWLDSHHPLQWNSVFVLPGWLQVWWSEFGAASSLYLRSIKQGEDVIGIAPLLMNGGSASFIGSADICDYQDFVIAPGKEQDFFNALLDDLDRQGVTRLDLRPLRPDSTVLASLANLARDRGCQVSCEPDGVTLELDLPSRWDEYLQTLKGKQRHEIRRKLRRLEEAAEINYRVVEDPEAVKDNMDIFLDFFRESRKDKTAFMTAQMESFFRALASALAEFQILKLCFLELDTKPSAAVMCFDYNDTLYLYNSGYDLQFGALSVGVICKILSIKESIKKGKKKYDFLKGAEAYKHHLGGKEVPLSRCQILLS